MVHHILPLAFGIRLNNTYFMQKLSLGIPDKSLKFYFHTWKLKRSIPLKLENKTVISIIYYTGLQLFVTVVFFLKMYVLLNQFFMLNPKMISICTHHVCFFHSTLHLLWFKIIQSTVAHCWFLLLCERVCTKGPIT